MNDGPLTSLRSAAPRAAPDSPTELLRRHGLRALALLAVVALLAVSGSFIWSAVAAGVGLLTLALVIGAGFVALQALPLAAQKLENRLLAARKAEARANPIEELQNHLRHRAGQVERFRAALAAIYAQIEGLEDLLDERRRQDPDHDLSRQRKALQKMHAFYVDNVGKLGAAERALLEYRRHIEMKTFEWNFATQGGILLGQMKATDQESILRELLSDEASQSVKQRFNEVFAELDMEVRMLAGRERMDFGADLGLDLKSLGLPEAVTRQGGRP